MIRKYVRGRVCVFIDAANLENAIKDLDWWMDYRKLWDYFTQETRLTSIRFYCPRFKDRRQDKFFVVLKHIGYKLITKSLKIITDKSEEYNRKANFDVEIALDAWTSKNDYDTLILFSGDSDFDYLIKKLRQENKRVMVISSRYHISHELIKSSYKYIDLKKLRKFLERKK